MYVGRHLFVSFALTSLPIRPGSLFLWHSLFMWAVYFARHLFTLRGEFFSGRWDAVPFTVKMGRIGIDGCTGSACLLEHTNPRQSAYTACPFSVFTPSAQRSSHFLVLLSPFTGCALFHRLLASLLWLVRFWVPSLSRNLRLTLKHCLAVCLSSPFSLTLSFTVAHSPTVCLFNWQCRLEWNLIKLCVLHWAYSQPLFA